MSGNIRVSEKKSEAAKEDRTSHTRKSNYSQPVNSSVDRILFLQRAIGNQAVGRLIKSGALQSKLRIGQPGDEYEQEADRVAKQVMRLPEPCASEKRDCSDESESSNIQRKCPLLDENELQKQPTEEHKSQGEVNPKVEQAIERLRGGGQVLDSKVRLQMELAFGADFSGVRIHTDSEADALNRSLDARAFTIRRDIFFSQSEYSPESSQGRQLLAHELTHVVQQGGNAAVQTKLTISQPQDSDELEAEEMAKLVTKKLDSRSLEMANKAPASDMRVSPQFAILSQGLQLARTEHNIAAIDLIERAVNLVSRQPDHPFLTRSSALARITEGSGCSCNGPALSSDECPKCMAHRLHRQGMPQGEIKRMVVAREKIARQVGGRTRIQCINNALSSAGIPWAIIALVGVTCGLIGLLGGPAAPATVPTAAAVCIAAFSGLTVGFVLGVIIDCIRDPNKEWIFAETESGGSPEAGSETATG